MYLKSYLPKRQSLKLALQAHFLEWRLTPFGKELLICHINVWMYMLKYRTYAPLNPFPKCSSVTQVHPCGDECLLSAVVSTSDIYHNL